MTILAAPPGSAPWGDPTDLYCERHNLTYAHDCDPDGCDCECPLCEEEDDD